MRLLLDISISIGSIIIICTGWWETMRIRHCDRFGGSRDFCFVPFRKLRHQAKIVFILVHDVSVWCVRMCVFMYEWTCICNINGRIQIGTIIFCIYLSSDSLWYLLMYVCQYCVVATFTVCVCPLIVGCHRSYGLRLWRASTGGWVPARAWSEPGHQGHCKLPPPDLSITLRHRCTCIL